MNDFNLLNRASFDDKQLRYVLKVQPFIHEGHGTLDLKGPQNVLWIKSIDWRFRYKDVGIKDADKRRRPPKPVLVTVENILENEERPFPPFTQPKPVVGKVAFKVINTNLDNNHQLIVEFLIDGVLVKPKNGAEITLKEMMSYVMMGSDKRGELAMAEAVTDKLDEQFASLGLGSIRDKFPGGLGAFSQLPQPVQNIVLGAMVQKGELQLPALGMGAIGNPMMPQLAMTEVDLDKESSIFIGDIISSNIDVSKEQAKEIAKLMIEKGWRKV